MTPEEKLKIMHSFKKYEGLKCGHGFLPVLGFGVSANDFSDAFQKLSDEKLDSEILELENMIAEMDKELFDLKVYSKDIGT